jgi:hypothetical protein
LALHPGVGAAEVAAKLDAGLAVVGERELLGACLELVGGTLPLLLPVLPLDP